MLKVGIRGRKVGSCTFLKSAGKPSCNQRAHKNLEERQNILFFLSEVNLLGFWADWPFFSPSAKMLPPRGEPVGALSREVACVNLVLGFGVASLSCLLEAS